MRPKALLDQSERCAQSSFRKVARWYLDSALGLTTGTCLDREPCESQRIHNNDQDVVVKRHENDA
jgi:hypothetical protein